MMNTKFKSTNPELVQKMTKLWSQIFAVMLDINRPILPTVIWLNEHFEDIYLELESETEVYKFIFDLHKIHYIESKK